MNLVVGGDSGIGRALLAADPHALATSRRGGPLHLDLSDDPAQWQPPAGVEAAFLCAAVTAIAACERDPAGTRLLNVERTVALARRLEAAGAFVVFLSTNQVFDGSQPQRAGDSPVCPQSEYGRQKAAAERLLGESVAVVRLTKVVAPDTPLFRDWAAALRAGERVRAFTDLVCAPLPLGFVARALLTIGAARAGGVWQLSGERDLSYAELARYLATQLGANAALVETASAADAGLPPSARPRHTTLDTSRWRAAFDRPIPSVWQALDTVTKG